MNVGVYGFPPKTKTNKNMRRHVNGVRGIRRDFRVAAGGVETLRSELRSISGVNQIVCDPGIVGMRSEERFKEMDRLFPELSGVFFVFFCERDKRKRIESSSLDVVRKFLVKCG